MGGGRHAVPPSAREATDPAHQGDPWAPVVEEFCREFNPELVTTAKPSSKIVGRRGVAGSVKNPGGGDANSNVEQDRPSTGHIDVGGGDE